eukprot:CAMPEP_0172805772 /NCGR_PEP_ID=MMETSP1075-20121228/5939_1 /TAXON_ID=2916 /ORGANISM="Ceratium fusus, Strain PA161109" /LENGTH=510 /DNA_ID=CAMNT_0013644479 /DNA_START=267 /DNA_END=1799 /DNA_ORIENTATION=+
MVGMEIEGIESDELEKAGDGIDAIHELLTKLGFPRYLSKFIELGFDTMAAVEVMTESDMREECGMANGHADQLRRSLEQRISSGLGASTKRKLAPQAPGGAAATAGRWHIPKATSSAVSTGKTNPEAKAASWDSNAASGSDSPEVSKIPPLAPAADLLAKGWPAVQTTPVATSSLAATLVGGLEGLASRSPLFSGQQSLWAGLGTGEVPGMSSKVPAGVRAMLRNSVSQMSQVVGASPIDDIGDPMAVAVAATAQPDGAPNTLYALAQMAQESSHYAQQAVAFSANSTDASQINAMAEAAEHAVQRCMFATQAVSAYETLAGGNSGHDGYIAAIQQLCHQSSEAAVQAAAVCRASANSARAVEEANAPPVPQVQVPRGEKRSRVPCKFFEGGLCQKGDECPLSHNPSDKQPLPFWQKRQYMCTFFEEDKCIRGASCAFAHGAEELDMIIKFKAALKEENNKGSKPAKWPGDWDCPGCNDRQFARNGSCRKCGEPRPLGLSRLSPPRSRNM